MWIYHHYPGICIIEYHQHTSGELTTFLWRFFTDLKRNLWVNVGQTGHILVSDDTNINPTPSFFPLQHAIGWRCLGNSVHVYGVSRKVKLSIWFLPMFNPEIWPILNQYQFNHWTNILCGFLFINTWRKCYTVLMILLLENRRQSFQRNKTA